jgi:RNA polymerase-binding transcription factor DksA
MDALHARLERQLRQTMERLRQLGGAIVVEDVPPPVLNNSSLSDSVDSIRESEDREISLVTRGLLVERANRLADALDRLRTGTYGLCEQCGEPIAPARLEALPEVTTCVRCQDWIERQAKRSGAVKGVFGSEDDED